MLTTTQPIRLIRQGVTLAQPITLNIDAGDVFWVRGANGVGKSTLLQTLAGLVPEHTTLQWKSPKPRIFYLGHQLGIVPEFTVFEHCLYHPMLAKPRADTIRAALGQLGLRGGEHRRCAALSRGQAQRLALAVLILSQTELWLLDEPFTGLDPAGILLAKKCIQDHTKHGATVVVSHEDIAELSTKVLILGAGVDAVA